MNIKGKIVKIGDTASGVSAKGEWSKTDIWVEEIDKQYPDSFILTAWNKSLEGFAPGMIIKSEVNARASEYNGYMRNSLLIFKIDKVIQPKSHIEREYGINPPTTQNPSNPIDDMPDDENSDLPF